MNSTFLKRIHSPERPVLVFDGGMGTSLQTQNLTAEDFGGAQYEGCNEYLVFSKPEAVEQVHREFLSAGADVIETDTFGSASIVLAEYDLADKAYELSKAAAELAKRVTVEFSTSERPRFVAGSMGPTTKLPTLGHIDFDSMKASFFEQAEGLYDGGADFLLVETCQDVLQIKAALNAIEDVFAKKGDRLPLMVSITMEVMGTMLVGTEISAALAILERYPIDILGLNCATGPEQMKQHIRYLSEHSPFLISCIPNAGLPENVGGKAHYRLTPMELRMELMHFVEDLGVRLIGGCCGTRPDHIAQLAEVARVLTPKERQPHFQPAAASIYSTETYNQENSFLIVGERLNASGSKKMRGLLNREDWDGLVSIAKSQVREGAQILDVNVDYVGRNGERDMYELASRLVNNVTLPLMLDSTEWEKMEAGLKVAGGKCILNSTNYEDGEERFLKVLELAKCYGAGVVIGTIDEEGMARIAEKKFAIAQRAFRQAVEFGIPAHELFFDTLALPISTGIEDDRANARETIVATQRIRKELPGCHVILGVSNISFGLNSAARVVLNSMFLHECMAVGMDAAIVSASKILPLAKIEPEHREVCRDLIYDRRRFENDICVYDPLTKLTEIFAGQKASSMATDLSTLSLEDKLRQHIIDGERIGLDDVLDKALQQYSPLEIINIYLLDGMKTVGELFGSGQMQLPFVLQSAETMKSAVAHLEPHMEKDEASDNAKGVFVIATVKGDVHDIGKNLVDIILSNNGYRVINLGIKQPVETIIEAYREHNPDCIAMSGLLVKSTAFMKDNLEVFNREGITVPVILGGAALTPKFVNEDCQNTYNGRVVYGKDAFADLNFMDKLMPAKSTNQWDDLKGFLADAAADEAEAIATAGNGNGRAAQEATVAAGNGSNSQTASPTQQSDCPETPEVKDKNRSEAIAVETERPTPPFWGTQLVTADEIPFDELLWYLDLQALVAGQWQFRKPKDRSREEYDAFLQEKVYPILEDLQQRVKAEALLEPRLVYGYFPCHSEGNSVHLYDPEAVQAAGCIPDDLEPLATFEFPRQRSLKRYCIADYYAPKGSGIVDVFPMQAVTVGEIATEYAQKLFADDRYTDYLYFHGLAVQVAEALAEWGHARVRRELGFGAEDPDSIRDVLAQRYRGSRFSFGYPACPNIQDQYALLELLGADRLKMYMDESEQLYPEQSTTAIVAYHPTARYFSA
ncbi:5-methyltetrahydrofolate--homocysteine methyltransferase [Rubidibacter lacunae KORDI 51-2]|uniref:Methionine synthase n=1 Tax=Rubidibacter lacunae KORDI 51-2 TaxID=582515 RepID=U5DQU6_9CHRO|nr:methionine synthase [Rubidibacter lacunae]ERN42994.1 5-methyltetrahydrofolate--homocysteine methyltransferase [Rubidibacter lacunae KORDI 51-2]